MSVRVVILLRGDDKKHERISETMEKSLESIKKSMGKLAKTKMFQIPCKFAIYFSSEMPQIERFWFQNAANNKENWFGLQNKKISPPKKQKNITHCWLQRARRTPKEFWHLRSNQVAGYIKTPAETFGDPDSLRLVRFVGWKTCSYATISSCGDCLKDHD